MVEIECPFCERPGRLDVAAFMSDPGSFRCDDCDVVVEVTDPRRAPVALAA
jgi:hypothetical protein